MKIWIINDYNYSKYLFFKNIVEAFSKEYGIDVSFEIKSKEELWNNIFGFFENPQDKLADIIEIPHQWTSLIAKLGLCLGVELIVDDIEKFNFFPFIKKGTHLPFSQKMFSLPLYFEVVALYYRKDMIKNVISPHEFEKIKWNDFPLICNKLKKKYKQKEYYPIENTNIEGYITSDDILVSVMNKTEGYFSQDNTILNLHKSEVFSSIMEYLSLASNKFIPLFEENFYDIGFIKKDLSSMAFSFRRDLLEIENMEVTRFPDIIRKYELARSFNFIFFSGTNDVDEIKKFILWFYNSSNLVKFSKLIKTFSPVIDDMDNILNRKEKDFFLPLFDRTVLINNNVVYPTFEKMMNEELKEACVKILNGNFSESQFKEKLLEIKAVVEYLITSY